MKNEIKQVKVSATKFNVLFNNDKIATLKLSERSYRWEAKVTKANRETFPHVYIAKSRLELIHKLFSNNVKIHHREG